MLSALSILLRCHCTVTCVPVGSGWAGRHEELNRLKARGTSAEAESVHAKSSHVHETIPAKKSKELSQDRLWLVSLPRQFGKPGLVIGDIAGCALWFMIVCEPFVELFEMLGANSKWDVEIEKAFQ